MILQDLFDEYEYSNIVSDVNGEKTGLYINYFYDKDVNKPSELMQIYLSKNKDELFFVLNGKGMEIVRLCRKWDLMIRDFMIFGSGDRNILKRLKYNAVQLILFQNDIKDRNEELSLNISRKIFLRCTINEMGQILLEPEEELKVPFYLIKSEDLDIDQELSNKLQQYIPKDDPALSFLNQERKKANKNSKSFLLREYDLIKGWLINDENSKN